MDNSRDIFKPNYFISKFNYLISFLIIIIIILLFLNNYVLFL
jgi:hypothetical protein